VSGQLPTPAECADGTAAMQVSRRRAAGANIAGTAERVRLLLANHVRTAAAGRGAPPLAPADPGGPVR
jgi:hypothetical protein